MIGLKINRLHQIFSVRTEHRNPHLISARILERKSESKTLAYLVDPKTISIENLMEGSTVANVQHDSRIDMLELNEPATKLGVENTRSFTTLVHTYILNIKNTLI